MNPSVAQDFQSPEEAMHHAAHSGYTHFTQVGGHITVYGPGPDGKTTRAKLYYRKGKYHLTSGGLTKKPIPQRAHVIEHEPHASADGHVAPLPNRGAGSPPPPDHRVVKTGTYRGVSYKVYEDYGEQGVYALLIEGGAHNGAQGWHQEGYRVIDDAEAAAKAAIDAHPTHYGAHETATASAPIKIPRRHEDDLVKDPAMLPKALAARYAKDLKARLGRGSKVEITDSRTTLPRNWRYGNITEMTINGATVTFRVDVADGESSGTALRGERVIAQARAETSDPVVGQLIADVADHFRGGAPAAEAGEAARLTPDVLPYAGYGIQTKGEYAATLAFLRAVRDEPMAAYRLLEAPVTSNEYMGAMAALRGGLVRQAGHDRTGLYVLTPLGREYLAQREGQPSIGDTARELLGAQEKGLVWLHRPDGVYWANARGGTYWLMPTPSGQYNVVWTAAGGDQKDLGTHSLAGAYQAAARFDPEAGQIRSRQVAAR